MKADRDIFAQQGFGAELGLSAPMALLLVDFVNGFADPSRFGGGNIEPAMRRSEALLAFARSSRWPVAHTRVVFADDGSDGNLLSARQPKLLALTESDPASAIVEGLAPLAGELVIRKRLPSAFFGTEFAPWLASRGIRTLAIGGCVTSGCVRASVVDALSHGFRPVLIEDCVGDRALAPHEAAIFDMRQKYADVMALNQLTDRVAPRAGQRIAS